MNYDRMRKLAGVPEVAPKAVVIETAQEAAAVVVEGETPDASSRCANCNDSIDPRNYDRTARGFLCVPCAEELSTSQSAYPNESVEADDKAPVLNAKTEKGATKAKVPADVTSAINSRIAELKQSIAQYNEKGYDDGGVKVNAIEALERIAADLKLEDGLTIANIFYGTLMSPITDLLPPKVVKFLHSK